MLKLKLNGKEYKVKLIKVLAFKKKQKILLAQGDHEDEIIDDMINFLVDIYSYRDEDKVKYQFTAEDIDEYLPLNELNKVFTETVENIVNVFGMEDETKKK